MPIMGRFSAEIVYEDEQSGSSGSFDAVDGANAMSVTVLDGTAVTLSFEGGHTALLQPNDTEDFAFNKAFTWQADGEVTVKVTWLRLSGRVR